MHLVYTHLAYEHTFYEHMLIHVMGFHHELCIANPITNSFYTPLSPVWFCLLIWYPYLSFLCCRHQFNLPKPRICSFHSPSLNPFMMLGVEKTRCYWKFLLAATAMFKRDRLSRVDGTLEMRANTIWVPFPALTLWKVIIFCLRHL